MFKKYIQDIAKNEAHKVLLSNYREKLVFEVKQNKALEEENKQLKNKLTNNIYFNMYQKQLEYTESISKEKDKENEKSNDFVKFLEQENKELKESLEKQKQRQYETNEFWSQRKIDEESEKLKQENENLNEKLTKISNLVNSCFNSHLPLYNYMGLFNTIRIILKES